MHPSEPPSGAYELLSTKLVPPQPRTSLTTRPRLLSRLNDGLSKKVTLISAPAGFGKTTLAGEWIAQRREHDELPSLAWVSLDEGDNDPVRFWRYVLTACRAYDGDAGETSLALLNRSPQPPFEALLTRFINEVARVPGRMVLALEDYHLITSRQIHETLVFFIDNAPATLHLLLLTRSDPPLPLARLRAYNELNELRAIDLRFTMEEVHNFLKTAVSFPLSKAAAARLAQRTEGWAAGLRLVALAVQRMAGQSEIE
ncbi:MAG TPA: LuxR family transcriptional regulator, partial [Candidatus Binatia bacterium]|nr:LuxR family transcriptional regulator [Candidatus Binatia bacterium]